MEIIAKLGSVFGMTDSSGMIFQSAMAVLFVLWVAAVIRVVKDISQRTENVFFEVISIFIVIVFTPILGLPLYLAIRPTKYLYDILPRREALTMGVVNCHACHAINPEKNNHCVFCGDKIVTTCKECKTNYPKSYQYCSVCGAPNIE